MRNPVYFSSTEYQSAVSSFYNQQITVLRLWPCDPYYVLHIRAIVQ